MPFHFNWQVELHPVIVHFAVGLLCFALLLDAIGAIWKSQSARLAALYCLIGGTVATVLSVVSGKITPEAREREGDEALPSGYGLHMLRRRASPDFVSEFLTRTRATNGILEEGTGG